MSKKKVKKVSNFAYKPFDFLLVITVLFLLSMGIIMVLSSSSPSSLSQTGSSYTYVKKQIVSAIIGIGAMLFLSRVDYRFYKRFGKIAFIIGIILLIAVLVIGVERNEAKRWIDLKVTTFQPSEFVKFFVILFLAGALSDNKDKLKSFKYGFIPYILCLGVVAGLLLLEPHMSAAMIIIIVGSIMMVIAGCKIKHFAFSALAGIPAIIGMILVAPYRLKRVTTFLNPWSDPKDEGWQIIQSLYAIGSGGLFGTGLGLSKQKYLYIPEPHNDFIFSILAEELGFVGVIFVICLFAIFIWRGILIAMRAQDLFGSLLAIGITSLIGIQAVINIAVVTSSMPVTGMPLPFFSYGGTALIMLLACVGILLNISRSGQKA